MGRGIIDYLVRASVEPALLVTGVAWSLLGWGRAWIGGHDHFYGAPDTPLVPPCMCFVMMWEHGSGAWLQSYICENDCGTGDGVNEWTLC